MASRKQQLARLLDSIGLCDLGLRAQQRLLGPYIRAINYHDVPPAEADAFERQLDFFAARFESVNPARLRAFQRGEWTPTRPGLILTFDDGLRSHSDIVAPRLEARGFCGWFMVPIGFLETQPADQGRYADTHRITHARHPYGDDRIAIDPAELPRLAERHVIGCHSLTHTRLGKELDATALEREIPHAKQRLEQAVGAPVDVFAWVGGEESSYSRAAAAAISDAGFEMSFMTNSAPIRRGADLLQLQRTNVESRDADEVLRFQLSGAVDLLYRAKRGRVNRLTRTHRR